MSDNHDSLKRAHELGTCFSSVCMTFPSQTTFGPDWQLATAFDHYFLATIRVAGPQVGDKTGADEALLRRHGELKLPLCIKDNNRAEPMCAAKWRLPKTPESIPNSTVVMHLDANGNIDDAGVADVFGPTTVWEVEAIARARCQYLQAIQQRCPSPAWYCDNDNNEGFMYGFGGARVILDKSKWPNPSTAKFRWADRDTVRRNNLRLDEWIMANGGYDSDPDRFYPVFGWLHNAKYFAYDQTFRNSSPAGWQNRYTEGYSAWRPDGWLTQQFVYDAIGPGLHEPTAFDATGPSVYLNKSDTLLSLRPSKDTAIDQSVWEWNRAHNADAYRSVWVSCDAGGALNGALKGETEVVDPAMWKAWCAFTAWRYRANAGGVALNLRYWDGWNTQRAALMFGDPNEVGPRFEKAEDTAKRLARIATAKTRWAQLDQLGRPDLKAATIEDYVQAMIAGVDEINLKAQDFYCRGQTIPVPLPASAKYRVVAVRMPNDEVCVYGFTPCRLGVEKVTVPGYGDVELAFNGANQAYRFRRGTWTWGDR
jgi:hypothetical protein